jgi:nitrite reductase/ring-hydroxylating ferredoxin subunit
MGFFKRLFGICDTRPPADPSCWSYSDGRLEVDLGKAPELEAGGGAIRLEGGSLPTRVLLVRDGDGAVHAFENRCTHAGRRLDPLQGTTDVQCCSVGKTTFDASGKRLSGSGKDDITVWDVSQDGEKLSVRIG